MTTVNWEREPGEKVGEFVAALLLLQHPHGNRITPSKGDRGVDAETLPVLPVCSWTLVTPLGAPPASDWSG